MTRMLIGCPAMEEGTNRIRSYLLRNGGYGATAAGTEMVQRNFSHMQRNSYGAYGIFVTATAKRQRQNGNGMVETRHNSDHMTDILSTASFYYRCLSSVY